MAAHSLAFLFVFGAVVLAIFWLAEIGSIVRKAKKGGPQ
jgi:hypothetical protein